MNSYMFSLGGIELTALPSGALWIAAERLLAVSDLHLGKSERLARIGGALLPPYEVLETLDRLEAEISRLAPRVLVLLGDSFDDSAAVISLGNEVADRINRLSAGRHLIWIAGNHDPGPTELPGTHLGMYRSGPLTFRHIAKTGAVPGEVSGHYHPKARLRIRGQFISRPCFLADRTRVILPAFGTYTGGLDMTHPDVAKLLGPDAVVLMTGRRVTALPYGAAA
ncbi:MAG: ligase-associated DNA damage response endonuclease PdeM [Paracoccaceae bacterium]